MQLFWLLLPLLVSQLLLVQLLWLLLLLLLLQLLVLPLLVLQLLWLLLPLSVSPLLVLWVQLLWLPLLLLASPLRQASPRMSWPTAAEAPRDGMLCDVAGHTAAVGDERSGPRLVLAATFAQQLTS